MAKAKYKELPGRILTLAIIIMLAALLWFFDHRYPDLTIFDYLLNEYIYKAFQTLVGLAVIYLVFKVVFEAAFSKGIRDYKARYSFKKAVSVLYYAAALVMLITIWLENPQNLIVAYGLIGAGIAIALQDFFKNFVGGITILVNGIYRVGDRVEIGNRYGDVIDIGVFYTTLMEMKEWIPGDQATGRLTVVPNGIVLTGHVSNYTKDHDFIWDEIRIPITNASDWRVARDILLDIVKKETKDTCQMAAQGISKLRDKYYMDQMKALEPKVYLELTDNWINLDFRYTVPVHTRREIRNQISELFLAEIEKNENITVASTTIDIVSFPEKSTKAER